MLEPWLLFFFFCDFCSHPNRHVYRCIKIGNWIRGCCTDVHATLHASGIWHPSSLHPRRVVVPDRQALNRISGHEFINKVFLRCLFFSPKQIPKEAGTKRKNSLKWRTTVSRWRRARVDEGYQGGWEGLFERGAKVLFRKDGWSWVVYWYWVFTKIK